MSFTVTMVSARSEETPILEGSTTGRLIPVMTMVVRQFAPGAVVVQAVAATTGRIVNAGSAAAAGRTGTRTPTAAVARASNIANGLRL